MFLQPLSGFFCADGLRLMHGHPCSRFSPLRLRFETDMEQYLHSSPVTHLSQKKEPHRSEALCKFLMVVFYYMFLAPSYHLS